MQCNYCFSKFFWPLASAFCFISIAGSLAGCSGATGKQRPPSADSVSPGRELSRWTTIGYGGGGAMFFPAVSPHNPKEALVACDMTGSYVTHDQGESWRMFNLRGPVQYFVFDPSDPNVVYAKSIALFKSGDRGLTWKLFYPTPESVNGIVSKGDHAEERLVNNDSARKNVLAFAIDPGNSKKLYAAISIDSSAGFYSSDDGGGSWKKEYSLGLGVKNIFVSEGSPAGNRTIFVAGRDNLTVRDNGQWSVIQNPAGVKRVTTYSGGYDKQKKKFILYAMSGKSYFNPAEEVSGIFYSDDGGKTWENRESGLTRFNRAGSPTPEWRTIAASQFHPEVLYVSYNNIHGRGDTSFIGVGVSRDYGKTWTLAWKDRLVKGNNSPSANFSKDWLNDRFGPTWGENPFSIGVSPTDPDICFGTDFGRTVRTMDGGKTWQQVYSKQINGNGWSSRGLEVTTGYAMSFDPFDQEHIFICNTDIGLMESRDGAKSWTSATKDNGIPRHWQNSTYWMAFDPEVKGRAWAVMSGVHDLPRPKMWRKTGVQKYNGGILVTDDAGKSWTPVSQRIGEAALTHILIDPSSDKQSRTLYACAFGKGVYKSSDGGKTWQQKNKGISGAEPFAWRITRRDKDGVLFLIVARRSDDGSIGNDLDGALYRSDDGAESWKKIALPEGTNGPMSIIVSAKNPERVLLSAWGKAEKGKFASDTGGGICVSDDSGKSWRSVMHKDQHIHDITYDARNNTYYACGFNGSAYRSEDEGATWIRIRGYNFKWGKRVDPDPRNPEQVFVITFGGGVWYGPAKGDASATEDIVTPVLTR